MTVSDWPREGGEDEPTAPYTLAWDDRDTDRDEPSLDDGAKADDASVAAYDEPAATYDEPAATYDEPVATYDEPAATYEPADTYEPVATYDDSDRSEEHVNVAEYRDGDDVYAAAVQDEPAVPEDLQELWLAEEPREERSQPVQEGGRRQHALGGWTTLVRVRATLVLLVVVVLSGAMLAAAIGLTMAGLSFVLGRSVSR